MADVEKMRDRRSGGLTRKLAAAFAVFALVAVTLSAAFIYLGTRSTYLETQGERLVQLADYANTSFASGQKAGTENVAVWKDEDLISPDTSYSEFTDAYYATYDEYTAAVDEFNALAMDPAAQEQLYDHVLELDELARHYDTAFEFYSYLNLLDRVRNAFDLSETSVLMPLDDGETVECLAFGVLDAEAPADEGVPFLGDTLERSRADYPGLWQVADTGEATTELELSPDGSLYYAYAPTTSSDGVTWVIALALPAASLNAAVLAQMVPTLLITVVVYVVCLAALLVLFRAQLVRPLVRLTGLVVGYAESHDASTAEQVRSGSWPRDEVGMLADRTAEMIDETEQHVQSIASLEREGERVRAELELAAHIQASALPLLVAPFTGGEGFELASFMAPAKEVGGDFYDFFMVGGNRVAMVIADVSDKGVPAALFMMRAKATIRQLASEGLEPAEVMARANDELCRDNEQGMFVTAWFAEFEALTGRLVYVNAGHNPPLRRSAEGDVSWLRERSGLMLGAFDGISYRQHETTLAPGEEVVLYTDGVSEAMDEQGACLGEERLAELVAAAPAAPRDLVEALLEGVRAFAGAAPQADDITVLCLRREDAAPGEPRTRRIQ